MHREARNQKIRGSEGEGEGERMLWLGNLFHENLTRASESVNFVTCPLPGHRTITSLPGAGEGGRAQRTVTTNKIN